MKNSKYYDDFFLKSGPHAHEDPARFSKIASLCRGSVLDVGCGTGTLADYYPGQYLGVDFSSVAVKFAKETRRRDASFVVADLSSKKVSNFHAFDTIVLAEFLEHFKENEFHLEFVLELLKRDGRLVISVPNGFRVPDPSHFRTFTVPKLRAIFSRYGRVRFYNWPGAVDRIIMTVDLGQKNKEDLTLVIPAKDEEKGLETAILSAIDYVDNIVISVDSKSRDKTLAIAHMYADLIRIHLWKNDFSAVRNSLQKLVKTKYCLILDGHEYLEKCEDLDRFLSYNVDGLLSPVHLETGMIHYGPRIIKSSVRYEGAVHNQPQLKSTKKYNGLAVVHDRRNLQDEAAAARRQEQRALMVREVMTERLKRNPKDSRALFHLGVQNQSEKKYKEAIFFFKKDLKVSKVISERWFVCWNIAVSYFCLGRPLWALWFLRKAEKEQPDRWETAKMTGLVYMSFERWSRALIFLVDSQKGPHGDFSFMPLQFDPGDTWLLIGICFLNSRHYDKAKIAFQEAKKQSLSEIFTENCRRYLILVEQILSVEKN